MKNGRGTGHCMWDNTKMGYCKKPTASWSSGIRNLSPANFSGYWYRQILWKISGGCWRYSRGGFMPYTLSRTYYYYTFNTPKGPTADQRSSGINYDESPPGSNEKLIGTGRKWRGIYRSLPKSLRGTFAFEPMESRKNWMHLGQKHCWGAASLLVHKNPLKPNAFILATETIKNYDSVASM